MFSPPDEQKGEEHDEKVRDNDDELALKENRLSGMSDVARAVMGLDDYDEDISRSDVDTEQVKGDKSKAGADSSMKKDTKSRAPKRKARPRDLQDIPDAPLELTAREIKASLNDTSDILRRKTSDPLPILRRRRPTHGRGVSSHVYGDFIGIDDETVLPEEVVSIGGRHDSYFFSRHGSTAVPTVTQLGIPSARGLCPELQEVFQMTMRSDDLPFPLSKKKKDELASSEHSHRKPSEPTSVEEEIEHARDQDRTSFSGAGRPSILEEVEMNESQKIDDIHDKGADMGGMNTGMEGFSLEDNLEFERKSSTGARISDISFTSGVMGGFEDALLPEEEDFARQKKNDGVDSFVDRYDDRADEVEGKFLPVGAQGRGEVPAAISKEKEHWNARTSTVHKALNKRLEHKVANYYNSSNIVIHVHFYARFLSNHSNAQHRNQSLSVNYPRDSHAAQQLHVSWKFCN